MTRLPSSKSSERGGSVSEPVGSGISEPSTPPAEDRIADELGRLRIRHEARRRLDAELAPAKPIPETLTLAEMLADPPPPITWRIEGWMPTGTRGILAAQFKAGKTTLINNATAALVDGEDFLGVAEVAPVGRVTLIDLEMSPRMLTRWLADVGITNTANVVVYPLRGRVSALNIIEDRRRAEWAKRLSGTDVLILDPVRAALDALGLDENREAGVFLEAFDELMADAGIPEAIIAHHWGHAGERSRGDSRLLDWPDWSWGIARQDDDPGSPRYITAYGRDVEQAEAQLAFDEPTRRLTLVGGTRKTAAARAALTDILDLLEDESGLSGNQVWKRLENTDHGRKAIRDGLSMGQRDGLIEVEDGPRNAKLHSLSSPVRHSSPPVRQQSLDEFASSPIEGRTELINDEEVSSPAVEVCEVCDQPGELTMINGTRIHAACSPASWLPDDELGPF